MTLDIVGPTEIAALLRVTDVTVYRWRVDGKMPAPDAVLERGPVWERTTILEWAEQTGREVSDGGN